MTEEGTEPLGTTSCTSVGLSIQTLKDREAGKELEYLEIENTGFLILSMRYNLLAHFQQPGLKGEHRKYT